MNDRTHMFRIRMFIFKICRLVALGLLNDIGILVDEFRFMDASYSYLSVIAAKDCVIRAERL